jgi:microcystin-dependent protein
MASTFSPSLRIELIGDGDQSGIWGQTTNSNLGTIIEQAITGVQAISMLDANYTLSNFNGVADESRNAVLVLSGTITQQRNLIAPLIEKTYSIKNSTVGGFGVQIVGSSGTGVVIPNGQTIPVYCDGTNFYALVTGSATNFSVNGNLSVSGNETVTGTLAVTGTSTFTGSAAFSGVPTAPTAAYGTNTTQIATTAFVQASVPAGVILLWSGSIASIPTGWLLCNGSSGTPDLRDRFVVGAGSTYAVAATGGSATTTLIEANLPSHTHSISASGTTSTVNIDHNHSVSASGTTSAQSNGHTHTFSGTTSGQSVSHTHTATVTDPGHLHTSYGSGAFNGGGDGAAYGQNGSGYGPRNLVPNTTGISVSNGNASVDHTHTYSGTTSDISAGHTHTVSVSGTSGAMSANATHSHTVTVTGTSGATGSGTSFSNLPPYYALAYIMKA